MPDLELLLVRHGQTAFNAEQRFLGKRDVPLDAVGRVQARGLSVHPDIVRADAIVASPLRRAVQTATLAGGVSWVDPDLAELDQGHLEGLHVGDAFARYPAFFEAWARDPTGLIVPGGEALDGAQRRGLAALDRLADRTGGRGRFVVVSHALVLASVCAAIDGAPLRAWRAYRFDNVGTRRLRWGRGGWEIVR